MDRAQDWLKQAARCLAAARNNAEADYHEWAGFVAQQSAEKALKALVQSVHGNARGHSLTAILREMSGIVQAGEEVFEAARELDQVYVTSRCPHASPPGVRPSRYQIQCRSIPTDTLVYSESEYERLAGDPDSFLARALKVSVEL